MYEDRTYEALLKEGKAQISDDVLKSEGSLVHNALSILAYELERFYIQADYLLDQIDPETADDDNLLKLCAQRNIYPSDATYAVVKIESATALPIGSRFNLGPFNYIVSELISGYTYKANCETAGKEPNGYTGEVTPITYISGFEKAKITETIVDGEDSSSHDDMLKAYKESFENSAFGGNVEQYKENISKIAGIGGCKVYPVWNGGGTVKIIVQSSDYETVSENLIEEIQENFCPTPKKGYGIAAIGHDVTIESVTAKTVQVSTKITYATGYSWDTLGEKITEAIESYLASLRASWSEGDESSFITIYISRIEAKILEIEGILDVNSTTLNASTSNLELAWNEIPMLGDISHD